MKAEITPENKMKFFQLYSGQEVIWVRTYLDHKTPYQAQFINDGRDRKLATIAILKPLSSISDEDAIECGYEDLQSFATNHPDPNFLDLYSADYLRSKGYLVPFLGLSVDELIEAGWAKLTEL